MRACLKWPAILPWFILASALAVHADTGAVPAPQWAAAAALQVVGQWRFAYSSAVSCDAIEVSATEEGTHRLVYANAKTATRPTAVHMLAWADHPGCTIRVSQAPVPENAPAPSGLPVDGLKPLAVPLPSAQPTETSLQEVPFELSLPANARAVLVIRDDLAAGDVPALLPLLAAATKAEAPRIAVLAWDTFSTLRAGSLDAARGRLEAARLQALAGDRARAIEQYRAVLDLAGDLGSQHGSLASTSGYTRNRLLLDLAGEARRGLYGLVEAGGDAELGDLLPVADAMPRVPEQKRACARVAECLSKAGDHRGALVYALRVLDMSGDRGAKHTGRLPENQVYLDAVTLPTPRESIAQACVAVNAAMAEVGPTLALPQFDDQLPDRWLALEHAALSRDIRACRVASAAIREQWPGAWPDTLASLALGQRLTAHGQWFEAIDILRPLDADSTPRSVRQVVCFTMGRIHEALGLCRDADRLYAQAFSAEDLLLASEARLRRAQCKELAGEWDRALEKYSAIADGGEWTAQRAAQAVKRLEARRAEGNSPLQTDSVVYLGEDRQTQGDWHTYYGTEAFVLCAQQAPSDIWGGPVDLQYRPYTGRETEQYRLWISRPEDADPPMVWNPVQQVRRPANWDDRGEAYLIGTGPDLLVDLTVPAGLHRLSLYFVNDHTYYEPNREYTVYILSDAGKVLATTSVREFLNGVYKQFGVVGPQRLTVRMCRDLSMNVLLSGVFLDPIVGPNYVHKIPGASREAPRLTAVSRACSEGSSNCLTELRALARDRVGPAALAVDPSADWQIAHALHLGSLDEHAAFDRLVAPMAESADRADLLGDLEKVTASAFAARQYGVAQWAAAAATQLLSDGGDDLALKEHLRSTVSLCLTEVPMKAPILVRAAPCVGFARDAYVRYLALRQQDLSGADLSGFLRREARWYTRRGAPALGLLALDALEAAVGRDDLTAADHVLITSCSTDVGAEIGRLEAEVAAREPGGDRRDLQMVLLGCYLNAGDTDRATALAEAMCAENAAWRPAEQESATTGLSANAVYNVAVYHYQHGSYEQARVLLERVIELAPGTGWAEYARTYLSRIPNAAKR